MCTKPFSAKFLLSRIRNIDVFFDLLNAAIKVVNQNIILEKAANIFIQSV